MPAGDNVLILGATTNQIPLVRRVQAMGFRVVVAAAGDMSACNGVADELVAIDTSDREAILALARAKDVRGLVTCGTSTAICTIAWVNEQLDCKQTVIPHHVALAATYKNHVRTVLAPLGLATAGFSTGSIEEGIEHAATLASPVMVKASDGGGGKGIHLVDARDSDALAEAIRASLAFSQIGSVVIEEYLDGIVFGVESITLDGRTHVLAVPEKQITGINRCVTAGIFFPSSGLAPHMDRITEANAATIKALGIHWGPTHIDMILDPATGRIAVIDVGARLAGGDLGWALIPAATGYDLYGATIDLALGVVPPPPRGDAATVQDGIYASHFVTTDACGTLRHIEVDRTRLPRLAKDGAWTVLKRPGDRVSGNLNDSDRLVAFALKAHDAADLSRQVQRANEAVTLEIDVVCPLKSGPP